MSDTAEGTYVYDGPSLTEFATGKKATDGMSVLDRLKAKSVVTLKAETVTLPIPFRTDTGLAMAYSVYLSRGEYEQLVTTNDGDDFAGLVAILVKQCRGLVVDGQVQSGDDGKPLTFQSAALKEMLEAADAHDAVSALYGRDGDVQRAATAVIRECGWDMRQPLDPTRA